MLSVTKINSARNQAKRANGGEGYLFYLGAPSTRQRGSFDEYARGKDDTLGPRPFWAGNGAALLGLGEIAEQEQAERLARGFHPLTGAPLVLGAGDGHVMGVDMTFSAPKDFSAIFAAADAATRSLLLECLHGAVRAALAYAEQGAVTRHGAGGRHKQIAQAAVASCYTHFASRSLDPQLHVHAFLFGVGKRANADEWSALEHRPQFERKMATGALFRVELAARLSALGFTVEPNGPFFTIRGVSAEQREALSTRSREITEHARSAGLNAADSAARDVAALNTRSKKAEPPLAELLTRFKEQTQRLGLTPESVAAMRVSARDRRVQAANRDVEPASGVPFVIDREQLLESLMASQSCATPQDALALICERAMGRLSAAECLAELDRLMASEHVVHLGMTEMLTPVFTSRATQAMESTISDRVRDGAGDRQHRLRAEEIERRFGDLEARLTASLGIPVSLAQQRDAAVHIACGTGRHAFVEGWAGTGKTTMLKAVGEAWKQAGFNVLGCCQSASAAQNLGRETQIPSSTIASLLLALDKSRAKFNSKTILVLDEAGTVGAREFSCLQEAVMEAGGKLVCVGDPKQLQPIEAEGIFRSLMKEHGKAEIARIQRQRTDFIPLFRWLDSLSELKLGVSSEQVAALRVAPEDARMQAIQAWCSRDPKLARGFERWRERFDFEWMREAVESFATGEALAALHLLDERGRLLFSHGSEAVAEAAISAWSVDKTPLSAKTMIAGTRAEVAELNHRARGWLVEAGVVADADGLDVEIKLRDDSVEPRRFAPGDRLVFTMNDRGVGVANGVAGTLRSIRRGVASFGTSFIVELDDPNPRGEKTVVVPLSFARFDHAYCITNHKAQGRTFDAAYVLANPSMSDREWTYVASSRSRFATTFFVNTEALAFRDQEAIAHGSGKDGAMDTDERSEMIEQLAARMRRSRAKGTTLDYPAGAFNATRNSVARPHKSGDREGAAPELHRGSKKRPTGILARAHALLPLVERLRQRALDLARQPRR